MPLPLGLRYLSRYTCKAQVFDDPITLMEPPPPTRHPASSSLQSTCSQSEVLP